MKKEERAHLRAFKAHSWGLSEQLLDALDAADQRVETLGECAAELQALLEKAIEVLNA